MAFADFYFSRFKTYNKTIPTEEVSEDLSIIVVIPAYREYRLFLTVECLTQNDFQEKAEVIVVFNSPEKEDTSVLELHRRQAAKLKEYNSANLRFIPIIETDIPNKLAGAGFARKLGMDIALGRFNQIDNPNGIIVSLDADTLCEKNYLQAIYKEFADHPKAPGATIAFEHPIEGEEFPAEVYEAITLYELYLRYYIQALRFVGFPYAYHTVGSAFAVRAWAYARQGGMGLQQAGEDFYFLHKIIPLGNFFEIKSTKVYPSPRVSTRVPFGTGPIIRQIIQQKMTDYPTYDLDCFLSLQPVFDQVENFFQSTDYSTLPQPIKSFLEENDFTSALQEMRQNSAAPDTFRKRFFAWFDAFRVLKFLNFCSENFLPKQPVSQEAQKLLKRMNINFLGNLKELLMEYRNLQNT